jgi:hypothetical protein
MVVILPLVTMVISVAIFPDMKLQLPLGWLVEES